MSLDTSGVSGIPGVRDIWLLVTDELEARDRSRFARACKYFHRIVSLYHAKWAIKQDTIVDQEQAYSLVMLKQNPRMTLYFWIELYWEACRKRKLSFLIHIRKIIGLEYRVVTNGYMHFLLAGSELYSTPRALLIREMFRIIPGTDNFNLFMSCEITSTVEADLELIRILKIAEQDSFSLRNYALCYMILIRHEVSRDNVSELLRIQKLMLDAKIYNHAAWSHYLCDDQLGITLTDAYNARAEKIIPLFHKNSPEIQTYIIWELIRSTAAESFDIVHKLVLELLAQDRSHVLEPAYRHSIILWGIEFHQEFWLRWGYDPDDIGQVDFDDHIIIEPAPREEDEMTGIPFWAVDNPGPTGLPGPTGPTGTQ